MQRIDKIIVNNIPYFINIHFEIRKNSYFSVGKSITIRLPIFLKSELREKQIEKFKIKIINYLEKNQSKFSKKKEYLDNQVLSIFDTQYILKIKTNFKKSSSINLFEQNLIINLSKDLNEKQKTKVISILISKFLSKKYLPFIIEKVNYFNNLYFKKEIKTIKLRKATSRLGSCSVDRKLMFSTTILLFPMEIIDYIVVHELSHTIELNHSKRFWKIVKDVLPDYKDRKKWLKENSLNLEI